MWEFLCGVGRQYPTPRHFFITVDNGPPSTDPGQKRIVNLLPLLLNIIKVM